MGVLEWREKEQKKWVISTSRKHNELQEQTQKGPQKVKMLKVRQRNLEINESKMTHHL